MSKVYYLAGPLTDRDPETQIKNIVKAVKLAASLRSLGLVIISPHEQGKSYPDSLDYEGWMAHCLTIIPKCDGIIMMPGWTQSAGSKREAELAVSLGLQVVEL